MPKKIAFIVCSCLSFCYGWLLAQPVSDTSQKEVIYGRKDGMALTMVVLTPKEKTNGRGIVSLVSGGWYSSYQNVPSVSQRALC